MNNQYISSRYNHMIEVNSEEHLLFNARTLATVELDSKDYLIVTKILASPNTIDESDDVKQELISGGFLIASDFNEKQAISEYLWQARRSKEYMSLTIAPTIGCNFNCSYCFESEAARADYESMSENVINKLIEFVDNHIHLYGVKELEVCWFGGEPLLALNAIEKISESFISLCKRNQVKYSANIISNGYRLDKLTALKLQALEVKNAQITIDGPECIHDSRRSLKGGAGSFKRIVRNLVEAGKEINIIIRVNVDKQNYRYLEQMVTEIKQISHHHQSKIYLAPVHLDPTVDINYQAGVTPQFFSEVDKNFLLTGLKYGERFSKKPTLVSNACGADHIYSYMIGPKGELYHCWEDFGNQNLAVGSIFEGRVKNLDYIQQYYDFDPTQHEKCTDCTVMPLCMGGCPKRRLQYNGIPQCGIFKTNLREHLLDTYHKLNKIDEDCHE